MKIRWLGHSCFELVSQSGHNLITDPFDGSVGYPMPEMDCDAVTISHEHHDHNHLGNIRPARVVREDTARVAGFEIAAIHTFHDGQGGKKRGANRAYKISADGITILHLGDLGHEPAPAQYEAMAGADVLLLPVGGYYTIGAEIAWKITETLKPRAAIPMHYKTPHIQFPIADAEGYVALAGTAARGMAEVELTRENLPELFTVYLPVLYRP